MFDVVLVEGREALAANAGLVAMPSADGATIEIAASLGFTPRRAGWAGSTFPAATRTPDRRTP